MTQLVTNRHLGALALALQIGVVAPFGPASAQGDSQHVGYVMSQTSSTMMVLDTRTNTITKKVTHPDMVKPAWGRFHPSTKRYYAGGTGKFTVWDTTNLADPIHLKTVVPAPGSTGEYRGFLVYKGSKATIDGEVWVTNIKDHAVYVYRAADLEQATPLPLKVFGPDHGVRGPHYMQVRPTTNEVWLTNRTATTNGYFLRFDGTTHTVITTPADRLETTSTAGDEPTEFVFSRDGLLAYVGHHGNTITGSPTNSHSIAIVDAAAFVVKKLITTAATQQTPSYVDIDADASRVYSSRSGSRPWQYSTSRRSASCGTSNWRVRPGVRSGHHSRQEVSVRFHGGPRTECGGGGGREDPHRRHQYHRLRSEQPAQRPVHQ